MIDLLIPEILKSSISIAKEILGKRLTEKSSELLARKRKKEEEKKRIKLTPKQIKEVASELEKNLRADIVFSENKAISKLRSHIDDIKNWSSRVSFMDMRGSKQLTNIYVELDTYLMPLRTHFSDGERFSKKPLKEAVFDSQRHSIVLGQPGAGKTTSMKKICTLFFNNDGFDGYNFPILLNLRDLEETEKDSFIQQRLLEIFHFEFLINKDIKELLGEDLLTLESEVLVTLVDNLKALIILEAFDEIQTPKLKESALREIRYLTNKFRQTKIVITCRTGEFNYDLDGCDTFEISALSEDQIFSFVSKWIGGYRANSFLIDIKNSPFWDTAIKPLSLAHLCAIYERIGSIPDRPKTVYRKVVGLLLEEWDEQRSIKRTSSYGSFEPDRKFEFLTNLSYYLTVTGRTTVFNQSHLIDAYLKICGNFGLPSNQSAKVANEIESHTGLFIQTGYQKYEFAHKSLQEYLTAEYIVKLPSLEGLIGNINSLGAELAVATSISSNPSLYFSELVLRVFNYEKPSPSFYDAFITRLIQERPDFYPCEEIVLASFSLLNDFKNHQSIIELMKNLLSSSDISIILKYYRITNKSLGHLTLHRKKVSTGYKLKSTLSVPVGYFPEIEGQIT